MIVFWNWCIWLWYGFCLLYESLEESSSSKYLFQKPIQTEMCFYTGSESLHYPIEQELKPSVKEETAPTSKSNGPPKGTPLPSSSSAKAGSSTPASGPVSEEEIRAVLKQKTPVTTQDLVAKFKARLRSPEVSTTKDFSLYPLLSWFFLLSYCCNLVYSIVTIFLSFYLKPFFSFLFVFFSLFLSTFGWRSIFGTVDMVLSF